MFVISISSCRWGRQHDSSCWFRLMKNIRSRRIAVILRMVGIPTYCLHKASRLLSSPRSWRSACTWRAALPEVGFSSLPLPSQLLVSQSPSPFPRSEIRYPLWVVGRTPCIFHRGEDSPRSSINITIIKIWEPSTRSYIIGRFEKWEELLVSSSMGKICGTAHLLPRLKTLQIGKKCQLVKLKSIGSKNGNVW